MRAPVVSWVVGAMAIAVVVLLPVLAGQAQQGSVAVSAIVPLAENTIQFNSSQLVTSSLVSPTGTSLDIVSPAGALGTSTDLKMDVVAELATSITDSHPLPQGKLAAATTYVVSFTSAADGTPVTSFNQPLSLTFTYTASDVSGIDQASLKAYHWSGAGWQALPSTVNTTARTVTASASSFSPFALFGSAAVVSPPSPPGGGGGGGGGGVPAPVSSGASVSFSGRAYPASGVTILKDGQVAVTTIAGPDARFSSSLSDLTAGSYIFSVYADDKNGNRSGLFTFPVSLTAGATATVSGIFLAPTIDLDKTQVKQGELVTVVGYTAPGSEVTIQVDSAVPQLFKTSADSDGSYAYDVATSSLELGDHTAKSKAAQGGQITAFGKLVSFTVGDKTVTKSPAVPLTGDVTGDGRVNLIDFSILAYWYKRASPPARVDLNGDGQVNLIDFSIMAFYWTG